MHSLPLRVALGGAISCFAVAAFGAGYTVVVLPAKRAAHGGSITTFDGVGMAGNGRTFVATSTHFKGGAGFDAGEICNAAGDACKRLQPRQQSVTFLAVSGDLRHFAGNAKDADFNDWAVRVNGGAVEYLYKTASANAINRQNVVAGMLPNGRPYRYGTSLTVLPTLSSGFGDVWGIDDAGNVIGTDYDDLGEARAVMWDASGTLQLLQADIPSGEGLGSYASAIGADGNVYGASDYHDRGTISNAVRFTPDKKAISLGTLGAPADGNRSLVWAVNSHGVGVGWSTKLPKDPNIRAVVFKDGKVIDLATQIPEADRAKYRLQYAAAINDAGQILVNALGDSRSDYVTLRLDPLP